MKNSVTSVLALTSFMLLGVSSLQASDNDETETHLGKRGRSQAEKIGENKQKKARKRNTFGELLARDEINDDDLLNQLESINDFFKTQAADMPVFEHYLGATFLRKQWYKTRYDEWKQSLTIFTGTMRLIQMLPEEGAQKNYKMWFRDFLASQAERLFNASGKGVGPARTKMQRLITNSMLVDQIDYLKLIVLQSLDLDNADQLNQYAHIIDDIQNSTCDMRRLEDNGLRGFHKDLVNKVKVFTTVNGKNTSTQNLEDDQKKTFFHFYQIMVQGLLPHGDEDNIQVGFTSFSEQKFRRELANEDDYYAKKDLHTSKTFNLLSYFPAWISLVKDHGDLDMFLGNMEAWVQGVGEMNELKNYDFFIRELHAIFPKNDWKAAVKKFEAPKPKKRVVLPRQAEIGEEEKRLEIRRGFVFAKIKGTEEEYRSALSESDKSHLDEWLQETTLFPVNFKELRNATDEEKEKIQNVSLLLEKYNLASSELYKTISFTKELMIYNVDKCKHLYLSQAATVGSRLPLYLPHIILHAEQSDANLEMRVWGFYEMVASIFNDLTIREYAQDWITELSALCSGGLCMEARLKSLDTAYQSLKKHAHPIQILLNTADAEIPQTRHEFLARAGQFLLNGTENRRVSGAVKTLSSALAIFVDLQVTLSNSRWVFNHSTDEATKTRQQAGLKHLLKKFVEGVEQFGTGKGAGFVMGQEINMIKRYLKANEFIAINNPVPEAPLVLDSQDAFFEVDVKGAFAKLTARASVLKRSNETLKSSLEKKAVDHLLSLEGRKASDGVFTKDFLVEYISDILGHEL